MELRIYRFDFTGEEETKWKPNRDFYNITLIWKKQQHRFHTLKQD